MLITVLIAAVFLGLIAVFALVMPVRLSIRAVGGTDGGFDVGVKIMLYSGFAGIGIRYSDGVSRLSAHVLSLTIARFNVSGLVNRTRTAVRDKRGDKREIDVGGEKKPLAERLSKVLENVRKYRSGYHDAMKIVREIARFDFVLADITLGLGNPALTGMISGVIFALNGVLPAAYTIRPSFDFTREVIRGDIWADITLFSIGIWKNIFSHLSGIMAFARSRKKQEAEIVTQEA